MSKRDSIASTSCPNVSIIQPFFATRIFIVTINATKGTISFSGRLNTFLSGIFHPSATLSLIMRPLTSRQMYGRLCRKLTDQQWEITILKEYISHLQQKVASVQPCTTQIRLKGDATNEQSSREPLLTSFLLFPKLPPEIRK